MRRIFILLLALAVSPAQAFFSHQIFQKMKPVRAKGGGGMDGGGTGGFRQEEGAAWFYQDKKPGYIRTCVKMSKTFKASEEEAKAAIVNAFQTWESYIQNSGIYEDSIYNEDGDYPKNLKILTDIRFEDCAKDTELTFYFGVEDERVKEALPALKNPHGFAFRKFEDIDPVKGTSKGIVWILDPSTTDDSMDDRVLDWSNSDYLQAILNHEIGHVMGTGHFDGTIMREDIYGLISLSQTYILPGSDEDLIKEVERAKTYLTKIDHESKLFFNLGKEPMKGVMGVPGSERLKESFKYFMKREPVGEVVAELTNFNPENATFDYKVADEMGSKTFHVEKVECDVTSVNGVITRNKFRRVRKEFEGHWWSYKEDFVQSFQATMTGRMKISGMKPFFITMDMNPGGFGYFKPGENTSYVYALSNFAIHFLDDKMRMRIMYVDDIKDGTPDDDENK